MSINTIGDLAQSYLLRRQNGDLKAQMGTLIEELSSGRTSDVARHLSGSYSYLADVERNLSLLEGYDSATNEARLFTDTMQNALEGFQKVASDLGLDLITASQSNMAPIITAISDRAAGDLDVMLSKLNTNIGGRFLFSGIDTDVAPVTNADTMLTALRTELAGATDLADIQTRLDTWFGPGGGFETVTYQGSTTSLAPFALGRGETVDLDLRADDASTRALLKHTALAALAADDVLVFPADLRQQMIDAAGKGLSFEQSGVTQIRADLGYAQSRIEESATRISAERTSFQTARTELLAVDPYETVTRLEDVQFQLEGLYTITARLSRLSLTDYLA
ncbi:flagellin [Pseudooceanicola onchidii]|uniref:flagellin n=1 Tax=Pseudooceanicola onchidii TaxID=2562279 RepID=UPI0010A9EE21|nr:flagellin [Pseudooceanicola onchidii]